MDVCACVCMLCVYACVSVCVCVCVVHIRHTHKHTHTHTHRNAGTLIICSSPFDRFAGVGFACRNGDVQKFLHMQCIAQRPSHMFGCVRTFFSEHDLFFELRSPPFYPCKLDALLNDILCVDAMLRMSDWIRVYARLMS